MRRSPIQWLLLLLKGTEPKIAIRLSTQNAQEGLLNWEACESQSELHLGPETLAGVSKIEADLHMGKKSSKFRQVLLSENFTEPQS